MPFILISCVCSCAIGPSLHMAINDVAGKRVYHVWDIFS